MSELRRSSGNLATGSHVVIVGNGVAGTTCALRLREGSPELRITMIGSETPYFFSRTALMYALMDELTRKELEPFPRDLWATRRVNLVHDRVTNLDAAQKRLDLASGATLAYDQLVLALGARPKRAPWPGADAVGDGLVHFVSMQDLDHCERLLHTTRRAVVVGGGLIGIELVEALCHHRIPTTFLIREPWYWPAALAEEESSLVVEHLRARGVDVRLDDEVAQVHRDAAGRVRAVTTQRAAELECDLLGVCLGVAPNIDPLDTWTTAPKRARGIEVDLTLRTSLPDVYACGDCAEVVGPDGTRSVELLWYSAKRQGAHAADALLGSTASYAPPLFFNASKFFELEYTTVGSLHELPEGTPTLFRHLPGASISQRIAHDGERVLGFSMLGSRWDHELLGRWIAEQRPLTYVRENLARAQFDVELGRAPLARCAEVQLPLRRPRQRRT